VITILELGAKQVAKDQSVTMDYRDCRVQTLERSSKGGYYDYRAEVGSEASGRRSGRRERDYCSYCIEI
jgi:hypothetical protein